ncbi:MAG: hypothetical protein AB7P76_07125 [Candidatus Melainabacteria bacterium]
MHTLREKIFQLLSPTGWVIALVMALLATAVVVEGVMLYSAQRADSVAVESAEARESAGEKQSHVNAAPPQAGGGQGTRLLMKNMQYCWTPKVCVTVDQLTALLQSEAKGEPVNFDAPDRFRVTVQQAEARITPEILEGMFNESVFNYPGSKLKDLSVSITTPVGEKNARPKVHVSGQLNYAVWVPFGMDTDLSVDKKTNTIVIRVHDLKVLGVLPAKWLLGIKPFELDELLPLPANHHLTITGNEIRVKPFGLFPPPRLHGNLDAIAVTPRMLRIRFAGKDTDFQGIPEPAAKNFIYLQGGVTRFGQLSMQNTRIQIAALKPREHMTFFISRYQRFLPQSTIHMQTDGGILVHMPDHAP